MDLLDTNVVSELRKIPGGRADPRVTAWADTQASAESFLSAITVKELELGVLRIERREPHQGERLREWVEALMAEYAERVLPVDGAVARRAAALHIPYSMSDADSYIAATALTHGLRLVTRNVADVSRVEGLVILNPWEWGNSDHP